MNGSGTLTLGGTGSTYTGATTLNSGILSQGVNAGSNVLGATSSIIFNGGTLQYASSGATTDFSSKFSNLASQQYKIDTNGSNVSALTALTSSGGSLTKLGAGVLNLGGANTYNGTTITAGTVKVGNATSVGSGTVTLGVSGDATSGTLDLGGLSETIIGLSQRFYAI